MEPNSFHEISSRLNTMHKTVTSLRKIDENKEVAYDQKTKKFFGRSVEKVDYSSDLGASTTIANGAKRSADGVLAGLKDLRLSLNKELLNLKSLVQKKSLNDVEKLVLYDKITDIAMRLRSLDKKTHRQEAIIELFQKINGKGCKEAKETEKIFQSFKDMIQDISGFIGQDLESERVNETPAEKVKPSPLSTFQEETEEDVAEAEDKEAIKRSSVFMKSVEIPQSESPGAMGPKEALDKLKPKVNGSWIVFKENKTDTFVCMIKRGDTSVETVRMIKRNANREPVTMSLKEVIKLKKLDMNKMVK